MELTIDQALQKGIEMHKAGQIQEADRLYSSILKAQRGHPDANHNMGVLAVDLGKIKESLPFFKTALEAKPGVAQFWLSYIESLINLDQIADAKAVFDQAKDKGAKGEGFDLLEKRLSDQVSVANNTQAIEVEGSKYSKPNILDTIKLDKALRLANRKFKEGQLEEAKDIYQHILQKFPKNKQALTAIQSLTERAVLAPHDPSSHQLQPITNFCTQGQFQQALSHSIEMLEQFPHSAVLHNIAGACSSELKQYDAAIDRYQKAININPDFAEAYSNMAVAMQNKGDLDAAIDSYKQSLKIKPDYAEAYNNMSVVLNYKGNLEAAIDSCKHALKINPDFAEAYNNMGNFLRDKGDLEAAIDSYQQALTIRPDYAQAYNNMGIALKRNGNPDAAIDSYNQALKINPDYAEVYCNMGNSLKEKGDLEAAIISYQKVLQIKPNFAEASYNLGLTWLEINQYEKALEQFKANDFGISPYYVLRCLYILDKKSLFYDQLDYLINQGDVHPMIGSLGCLSVLRYGIERPNLFCKDPLSYVVKADLIGQYDFEEIFVKPIRTILSRRGIQKRQQGLLINGYQTYGNLFISDRVITKGIQKIIRLEVDKYLVKFQESKEGLITSWPSDYTLRGWLINMKSGGELLPHMHEDGWISGSVYINVPSKLKPESGNLVVTIADKQVTNQNRNQLTSISVATGSVCLFPASLLHYTIPFESEEERIVLAFDVIPNN